MKKLLILLAVMAFVACGKDPKAQPQKFPVGEWKTTHEEFSLEISDVSPAAAEADLSERLERNISADVVDVESYKLTFLKYGNGSGSAFYTEGDYRGRFAFDFRWKLSGDELSYERTGGSTKEWYDGVFFTKYPESPTVEKSVVWKVEESTEDRMVLTMTFNVDQNVEPGPSWKEAHAYRYTFERVK